MTAPAAPRDDTGRDLHGERVADPYRWMVDRTDPRLRRHLEAEREYYDKQTAPLAAERDRLTVALRERTPAASPSCPWWQNNRRHQFRYAEGAEHPQLLRWPGVREEGEPEVLLDVETLAVGHDHLDLGLAEISDDGNLLAYSIDSTGDENYDLRYRDLRTGRDLLDVVPGTFLSGAWSADGEVFFYTVLDEAFRSFEVWRHALGTSADDDVRVFHEDDRHFDVDVRRTRSGAFILIASASRSTRQEWWIDARQPLTLPAPLRSRRHGIEDVAEHHQRDQGDPGRWLLVTNDGAREFRMIAKSVTEQRECPDGGWDELRPGSNGERLEQCDAFADALVLSLRRDGGTALAVLDPDGRPIREILPDHPAGSVVVAANHEFEASGVVVEFSSLIHPTVYGLIDFSDGTRQDLLRIEAPGHDPERYVTERITIPARDGTPIPVTLAYARGTDLNSGTAPGLLYGYGSYEYPIWAQFSTSLPVWLDEGVVYARAHVRGGGEGGRTWWEQGSLATKQNTFTDYLDVAEYLVTSGRIARDRLATRGRSAGGLLQGAVLGLDADPDRWRVMVAEVPFVDCLNSMLDEDLPLTVCEWEEWGDPRIPQQYQWLRAYTPYENLPNRPLPAMLVTGALADPRVGIHEPAKWVAALRHGVVTRGDADPAPLLFRAEVGAGSHGGPSGRFAAQAYEAEVMAFVLHALRE